MPGQICKSLFAALIIICFKPYGGYCSEAFSPPFTNPALASSPYAETHYLAHYTPLDGPIDETRQLAASEIAWKKVGPATWNPLYSEPYPNGKRVIWIGGHDRIAKLDADTLETLTTLQLEEYEYYSDEIIQQHVDNLNRLDGPERLDYHWRAFQSAAPNFLAFYRFLSSSNELYLPYRSKDGVLSLRVYGESDPTDPSSPISIKRSWVVPENISTASIYATAILPDRHILIAFSDGKLVTLPEDLSRFQVLELPRKSGKKSEGDYFTSFLRNGIAIDDKSGIYVVTQDYMHRVQWTGESLSLNESDGAWTASYPNESGLGSGTTPALMGWGYDEDKLVLIADATRGNNNLLAYWRNEIPEDWPGIPGYDRRVAGISSVYLSDNNQVETRVENSIVVYGYGAFLVSSQPAQRLPPTKNPQERAIKEFLYADINEMRGGTMIRWNAEQRKLSTVWRNATNFATSICAVSGGNDTIYCWGSRNGTWTLEAVDWQTGKNRFHYLVGDGQQYNVFGGIVTLAPNGAVDCGCNGGFGMVRINPQIPLKQNLQK